MPAPRCCSSAPRHQEAAASSFGYHVPWWAGFVAVLQELSELCEDLVAGLSTEAAAHAAAKLQAISSIGRLLPGECCSLLLNVHAHRV